MIYYIIGIKGTGCASLACFLKDIGFLVLGSDIDEVFFTDSKLVEKDIKLLVYNENNLRKDYVYIIGHGAINSIEAKYVIKNNFRYYMYNEFINSLNYTCKIAISGTHGKTTTTALMYHLLKDLSPSVIKGDGEGIGNKNDILIFEACEYKNHFLSYFPTIGVINNIELDHPDFFKSKKSLLNSFQKFADNSKYIVVNGDDKLIKKIKHKNKITFGFNRKNDFNFKIIKEDENGYLLYINKERIFLPFTGKHMIYNFLACYSVIKTFFNNKINQFKLNDFTLPKRRSETWNKNNITFINDYAHHPTEIKALYYSLKQKYPYKKIIVLFQPHTYSRTLKLRKKFIKALSLFDNVYLEDVFNSREKIDYQLQKRIDKLFSKCAKINLEIFKNIISDKNNLNSVIIFLGAGNLEKYISLCK